MTLVLAPAHAGFAQFVLPALVKLWMSLMPVAPSENVTGVLAALSNVHTPVAETGSVVTGDVTPDAHEPITVPGLAVVQTTVL